jgi:hypothetical protein
MTGAVVAGSGELNGVAELLIGVIEEKLEENEFKRRTFRHMRLNVLLHVVDVGQAATMDFKKGTCIVSTGAAGKSKLRVECNNETVTQFTCFTLLPGALPNFFDSNGLSIVGKILTRKLVIHGLIRHLIGTILFIRLFSIPKDG